jgi:hypothetical protein
MRVFPLSIIATTGPCIDQLATTLSHGVGIPTIGSHRCWTHLVVTSTESSLSTTKDEKSIRSLSRSNTSVNRFEISYRSPMTSTRNSMIMWETKFDFICRNNALPDTIKIFSHSFMGHTPSPRSRGDNSFELNIPPFLGLHLVFNVDLLRPYFPPLLDTSKIVEQLKPIDLNHDCIQ